MPDLIDHILAMRDDAYFRGHPEWAHIVADADAANEERMSAAYDPNLDATDRALMSSQSYTCGICSWGLSEYQRLNVAFISRDGTQPDTIYSRFGEVDTPVKEIATQEKDELRVVVSYAEELFGENLDDYDIWHVLVLDSSGWAVYSTHSGEVVEYYDRTEQRGIDMADETHDNDIRRFGTSSDCDPDDGFDYEDEAYDEEDLT
jgi:hypothetical protein